MIYVIARNHQEGEFYCTHVADPPLNPRNRREVTILSTSDLRSTKGRHITDDDTIVRYHRYYEGKHSLELSNILRSCIRGHPKEVDA